MSESEAVFDPESEWPRNYFNYFTEVEEHFQSARGTGLFLLSPLDWALLESWQNAGVPLDAVLKGIDAAFEKWRSRKQKRRLVNSVAYCTQAVMEAAQRTPSRGEGLPAKLDPPFALDELRAHLTKAAAAVRSRDGSIFSGIANSLESLAKDAEAQLTRLEDLERRLTTLEEKLVAALRTLQTDEEMYALREALDRDLKPYRGKMTADQLSILERRYLDNALLDRARLPRLSLFYLH